MSFVPVRWAVRAILAVDCALIPLDYDSWLTRRFDFSRFGDAAYLWALASLAALPLLIVAQIALRSRAKASAAAGFRVVDAEIWITTAIAAGWTAWLLISGMMHAAAI